MTHGTMQNITDFEYWRTWCAQEQLSDTQQQQFALYSELLCAWNQKHNITAITTPDAILKDHFQDSLAIRHIIDLNARQGIADIGSGGGFPGLPLKICYPSIPFVLIEVNTKKIEFLASMISALELTNIEVYTHDWRTFLRQAPYSLDLFLARASLQPEELVRIFKPSSSYRDATMVYWASGTWQPSNTVSPFITSQYPYRIGTKQRKLVIFTP